MRGEELQGGFLPHTSDHGDVTYKVNSYPKVTEYCNIYYLSFCKEEHAARRRRRRRRNLKSKEEERESMHTAHCRGSCINIIIIVMTIIMIL